MAFGNCRRRLGWSARTASLLGLLAVFNFAAPCAAVNDVAGPLVTFNDNGAWSWFEDERAIVDLSAGAAGRIVVSSVAYVNEGDGEACLPSSRDCDVEVASYDIASGIVTGPVTLSNALQADDHDSAALLRLPDGRYLASYSKHSNDKLVRWRVSSTAGEVGTWGPEQSFTVNPSSSGGTTYANLAYLSESGDVFNFHREAGAAGGFDPHYLKWNLESESGFSYGGRLLTGPEGNTGNGDRPYLRYTSNGVDRIDFIATDAHPRNLISNSVYHGYIEHEGGGAYGVFQSDGTRLGPLSETSTSPYKASDFTTLLAGNTVSPANNLLMTRGWTTDVELDSANHPYAVFTARVSENASDHRFFYARHSNSGWNVHELAKAGGFLYGGENDYTGLVALDPSNPNRLFMSTKIDPRYQQTMPRYEIFEGMTDDGGASWNWKPITYNSTVDNIRPIVPKWDENHTALLWMRGTYTTYEIYDLDVVGLTEFASIDEPTVHVTPVTGPWTNAVGFGNGPISGANTASPIVGNGTANSAAQQMVHSDFAPITLASTGDTIMFTGSVMLEGTGNSPASEGAPRTQFRFGLFDGDATGADDNGWVGYSMSNRHGNSGSPAGVLAEKPLGNTSAYLSATGQTVLNSIQGDGTLASLFHDSTYAMNLTIQRDGDSLHISATLNGQNGFAQSLSATDATAATFTFDRLGFLSGMNLGADRVTFSNLAVAFISAAMPGDFNLDNVVDAADYVMWRKRINTSAKYSEWLASFGNSTGSGSDADASRSAPEPGAWLLLTVAAVYLMGSRGRQW